MTAVAVATMLATGCATAPANDQQATAGPSVQGQTATRHPGAQPQAWPRDDGGWTWTGSGWAWRPRWGLGYGQNGVWPY